MAVRRRKSSSKKTRGAPSTDEKATFETKKTRGGLWMVFGLVLVAGIGALWGILLPFNADAPAETARTLVEESPIPEKPRFTTYGGFEILRTIPHDSNSYTQGLELHNGLLYESAGHYNQSNLRQVNPEDGSVVKQTPLEAQYFAEGITRYRRRWIQLTWREKTALFYDDYLNLLDRKAYNTTNGDGWGICFDPQDDVLYVVDGSQYLHKWDPETLEEQSKVEVKWQRQGMEKPERLIYLNELEWDASTGTVLANLLFQNVILRIDPKDGFVTKIYDFNNLWADRPDDADVFNGIALTEEPDEIWVTGKWWPSMYLVRLLETHPYA